MTEHVHDWIITPYWVECFDPDCDERLPIDEANCRFNATERLSAKDARMLFIGPSKKRYKERIIKITKDLKEECVTEEWFSLNRLAKYAQHRGHCRVFLRIGEEHGCNCGFVDAYAEILEGK